MMSKITAAWQWTVCRRVGLFAVEQKAESPLAATSESKSPPIPPNVAPHDIWIKFLVRRFEVIKYYSADQVNLTATLEQSLKYMFRLCVTAEKTLFNLYIIMMMIIIMINNNK